MKKSNSHSNNLRLGHSLFLAVASMALVTPLASAAVVVESRSSGAVINGLVQARNTSNVETLAPIPGINQPPGVTFQESFDDATPPTFSSFSSGNVTRSATLALVPGPPNRRPGATASGTAMLGDSRLVDAGGQTVGFRAGGTAQANGGTNVPNGGFPGSASANVFSLGDSTWVFTLDADYRYHASGSATFSPPALGTDAGATAGYSITAFSSNALIDSEGVSTAGPGNSFTDTGILGAGKYIVSLQGGAGGTARYGFPSLPGFSLGVSWGIDFSLAALASSSVTVSVQPAASYAGITATPAGSTSASLLDGSANPNGGSRTVQLEVLTNSSYTELLGSAVELTGTSGDLIVLQLTYDDINLTLDDETALRLGWLDGNGDWVNAIIGNSDNGVGDTFINGAYDPALHFSVSTWGVDTAANSVWAVIDHNSTFGVVVVPEPATAGVLGIAAMTLLARRRRMNLKGC